MITFIELHRNYGGSDKMFAKIRGLSTDTKPTDHCNGSEFFEIDTQVTCYFNEETQAWITPGQPTVTTVEITTPPSKTSYVEGQYFDATGAKITLTLSDESTEELDAASLESHPLSLEDTSASMYCDYNGIRYSVSQEITVEARAVASLAVKTPPTKIAYTTGEKLTMAGLVVTATYNDTTTEDIAYGAEGLTYAPAEDTEVTHEDSIEISYGGKKCYQLITFESSEE